MSAELSIVIVSYNTREDLVRCIESVEGAATAIASEIVVVDNASTDGSVEAIRARWPSIRVLAQPTNVGFAAANNVGIRATRSELVLLLNSDTVVPIGAIDALVARLRAVPEAAAAGPRLIDADGHVELSFGPMISPLGELRQKFTMVMHRRRFRPMSRVVERATASERFVGWVSGAALLVYRRDAEAVGLLDERYFLYTEDVDFCAALRSRGRKILFTPAATITHLRGRSRATAPERMNTAYRRSHIAFYEKHYPRWSGVLKWYLRLKGELPD
jgi:GT2 family glycosyltransferase